MSRRDILRNDLTEAPDAKTKAIGTTGEKDSPSRSTYKRKAPEVVGPSTSKDDPKRRKSTRFDDSRNLTISDEMEVDSENESEHNETEIIIAPHPGTGQTRPSFLTTMRDRDVKPHPIRTTIFIRVSPHDYLPYFQNVYRAIMNRLYPTNAVPAGVCTEIQFTKVCRYLLKARIDAVFSQSAGRRIDNRTPVPRDYEICKSVADVINNIGIIFVDQGGLKVCPEPIAQATDEEQRPGLYGTFQNLNAVTALMRKAHGLGYIKLETISPRPEGTSFWIMTARNINDVIANNAGVALASAVFREFTPSDAIFCVMVQNGFDGSVGGHSTLLWTMEPITGIQELRSTYALQA